MIAVPNVNCVWEKCKVKISLLNKHLIHGFKTLRRNFVRVTSTRDNPILMNEKPAKTQATYVSYFIYTYSYYRRRYITVSVSNTLQRACGFACVFTLFRSHFIYIFIYCSQFAALSWAGRSLVISLAQRVSLYSFRNACSVLPSWIVSCVYMMIHVEKLPATTSGQLNTWERQRKNDFVIARKWIKTVNNEANFVYHAHVSALLIWKKKPKWKVFDLQHLLHEPW